MTEKLPYSTAFPNDYTEDTDSGVSILDYFAAHAISGLISLGKELDDSTLPEDATQADVVASQAYAIARAMMKEREIPQCDSPQIHLPDQ